MVRRAVRALICFALILSFAPNALSQANQAGAGAGGGVGEQKAGGLTGPRKQLATIVFAGLGGAILGLSTLSFYGRPQEKLNNIAIGFAFGIMAGTALVTYKAATNPSELYGHDPRPLSEKELASTSMSSRPSQEIALRSFSYQFEF